MVKHKVLFNWSTGKDSAMAFHALQESEDMEVVHLITSVNQHFDRVSMHGLRRELLEKQVERLKLPCSTIELPESPDMKTYESIMEVAIKPIVDQGIKWSAFGDIFLEDLKLYREQQLQKVGMQAVFPLWKKDTKELLHYFVESGFKAVVVCAKAQFLDQSFAGRELDYSFINDLPDTVDPCGENGEFHTFCYDGPIYESPIEFERGEVVYKAYPSPDGKGEEMGFWYCDLIPV